MKKLRYKFYRFRRNLLNGTKSLYFWRDKVPYYLGIKKAARKDMPDFIIAGLPKCGTVWLVRVLRSDGQFQYRENPFFKNKGEIRFFSRNFNQPISKYFRVFNQNRDLSKLAYEKSPDYSTMGKTRIRLIKKLNPNIKIILIFRHPVDRAFSNAKMDLIKNRGIELNPENEHFFLNHYRSQKKKYNYEKILKNWSSVFDKSQILILSIEDIGEKPFQVIEKTYSFLGKGINLKHDLFENPNASSLESLPISHKTFLEKELAHDIAYWEENNSMFRL